MSILIATFAGITPLAALIAYLGESNERLITGSIVIDRITQKRGGGTP